MTSTTCQQVAEEAIFQLEVAVSALTKARHLFAAIKPLMKPGTAAHELIELGEMFVIEFEFDGNTHAQKLEAQLEAVKSLPAPQNAEVPFRGAEVEASQ